MTCGLRIVCGLESPSPLHCSPSRPRISLLTLAMRSLAIPHGMIDDIADFGGHGNTQEGVYLAILEK